MCQVLRVTPPSPDSTAIPSPRSSGRDLLRKTALDGLRAVCEALYPDNDLGAPSWRDVDMIERASALWDELPPQSRAMMIALYASIELGGSLLAPGFGRFSRLPVERRLATLRRWKDGRIWPLRFLAEALKSSSTMIYMSHPRVAEHIGATKACGSTASHGQPVKANAFSDLLPRAERRPAPRTGEMR